MLARLDDPKIRRVHLLLIIPQNDRLSRPYTEASLDNSVACLLLEQWKLSQLVTVFDIYIEATPFLCLL